MKSSLDRRVYHTRSFTKRGNSTTVPLIKPRSVSNRRNSSSAATASASASASSSFVVDYLINSCGLSSDEAISASKKLNFKTSENPDSVLNLLETYGFTKPYISKLIKTNPLILLCKPLKNLKPKIEFLNSKGISGIELAEFLTSNKSILQHKSHSKMMLTFDMLKDIVHSDKIVVSIIKRCSWLLTGLGIEKMKASVELLRDKGVPESNISKFLISQPRVLTLCTARFKEIVEEIKGMGFNPLKFSFLRAVRVVARMSTSNMELRKDVYRRLGLSDEEIRFAFKRHPECMGYSEKKITATMDYLVNQMGHSPSHIARTPYIFGLNLEKRIIPRCSVYRFLTSKGLLKNQISLSALLISLEGTFLEKFVIKFEAVAPELLELYPRT